MNDTPLKPADQARNRGTDKTAAAQADGDAYASQGGGKPASGNVASGHWANNVITPQGPPDAVEQENLSTLGQPEHRDRVKGVAQQPHSEAGKLADDRPGRNESKDVHRSLNQHE
ncbi:hypothetical protein SAMN05880566_10192 [Janthinobacterium sp. TND4EL3]|uniref:hypothetical protein n=1 Tax=Janthinobacterium sp. TND4EL3 TaxID=1907311 RepID=UPI0009570694|nr:hypothetical protein [Janthinobacterium sp. TND4EL3]SIP91545.1 hypothetical protein SAMN05880566_10192 [Janthinobacterium sp. TND4EL3]